MEIKPAQLAALCIAIFGGIVSINILMQYRSNEQFREKFANIDFSTIRPRLVKEEGIAEPEPTDESVAPEE